MKELKFIHITKTAGTSIEHAGLKKGLSWGVFHEEYGWHHECFTMKPKELIDKYDWFTVVRNPYERAVSEFHCVWGRMGVEELTQKAIDEKDKRLFNEIIRIKIKTRSKTGNHYTEQHKYITDEVKTLKFERLDEEFKKLMSERGLDVSLDSIRNAGSKAFCVGDFDQETLGLINCVYEKDFKILNYRMVFCPARFWCSVHLPSVNLL